MARATRRLASIVLRLYPVEVRRAVGDELLDVLSHRITERASALEMFLLSSGPVATR